MYPVLLHVGPITIYSYGMMMALGFLAAGWVLSKELQRQGKDPNLASTLVLWAAVGGLVGARLLFLVEEWQAFIADPWPFIFTGAGFTWYGGLIGGVAAGAFCVPRHRLFLVGNIGAGGPAVCPRPGLWCTWWPLCWGGGLGAPPALAPGGGGTPPH